MFHRNVGNYQREYNMILYFCANLKFLLQDVGCVILGFRRSIAEVLDLLGCCTASVSSLSRCLLDVFILEDGTNALSRNVGNKLPIEVA
jgi:hypothetical protein